MMRLRLGILGPSLAFLAGTRYVTGQESVPFTCPNGEEGIRNYTGIYCPSKIALYDEVGALIPNPVNSNQIKHYFETVTGYKCTADLTTFWADTQCKDWCARRCGRYSMPQPATVDAPWLQCFADMPEGCIVSLTGRTLQTAPLGEIIISEYPSTMWDSCRNWSKPCCRFGDDGLPYFDAGCCLTIPGNLQCGDPVACMCDSTDYITLHTQLLMFSFPFQLFHDQPWASGFGLRRVKQDLADLRFYKSIKKELRPPVGKCNKGYMTNSSNLACQRDLAMFQITEQYGYDTRMLQTGGAVDKMWKWEFNWDCSEFGVDLTMITKWYSGVDLALMPERVNFWFGETRITGLPEGSQDWDGWDPMVVANHAIPLEHIYKRCYIDQHANLLFVEDAEEFFFTFTWTQTFATNAIRPLNFAYPDYDWMCGRQESCDACQATTGCSWCLTPYGQTCSSKCSRNTGSRRVISVCGASSRVFPVYGILFLLGAFLVILSDFPHY